MIAYLEGNLLKTYEDRIVLMVGQVGYEILLPSAVVKGMAGKRAGERLVFYIFFHQTERQPKPVLIGFPTEEERDFFQLFIGVEDIGPLKALKAMELPVARIAAAIEQGDEAVLKSLKGIGVRTAKKIIASLKGKMERFAESGVQEKVSEIPVEKREMSDQVLFVLVNRLGHKNSEARKLISEALKRKPDIATPEELFDEIYRGKKG